MADISKPAHRIPCTACFVADYLHPAYSNLLRMHVVYDKIAIDTAGRSPENNRAMAYRSVVELRDKQVSTDAWTATHQ